MNRLSSLFARRYLLSRKSHSVINIIARVSAFAVGVPVAAMVILLSVFNGFEGLVKGMFNDFDPDLAIFPAEGKVFDAGSFDEGALLSDGDVQAFSYILEDNALLEYRGRQYIGTVRGVDTMYRHVVPVESMVRQGSYELWFGDMMQAVVGQGIAYNLGIRTALLDPVTVLVPRRGSFSTLLPIDAYREGDIFPAGIFTLDAETDGQYILTPIEFTRELFDYPDMASAIMVRLDDGVNADKARAKISESLGGDYRVLTRYQQKASLYRIMTYEKWGIFVIILLVLIIASFSIIGSLAMLIIDKRQDNRTIINMGGSVEFLRSVFVKEGMLISTVGAAGGMAFGLLLCAVQIVFGIIKIPADTFLVDSYPVIVKFWDMVAVAAAFIAVNYIITKFTVSRMIPRSDIRI